MIRIHYSSLVIVLILPVTIPTNGIPVPISVEQHTPLVFGEGVMLQAFYWDVDPRHAWWDEINKFVDDFSEVGFDSVWLPPPSKSDSGGYSMGYDPYDYYDLGDYDQKGTVETRFGSKAELENLITNLHDNEIAVVADIVINHNSGGNEEYNPNTGGNTYTNFENIASGMFPRNYTHFHPCAEASADAGSFGGFPDLCHENSHVKTEVTKWAEWLKTELKFDAWRFDFVKGLNPQVVVDWMDSVGGWGVAEFWDGNKDLLNQYITDTESKVSVFDFALMYQLREMAHSDGSFDMNKLDNVYSVMADNPLKSVSFVANHDTDREEHSKFNQNKDMAYAFILTHEGYPSVFWADYFDMELNPQIKNLIEIHNLYAKGTTTVLHTDGNTYIAQRNGDPGLVVMLNDHPTEWQGRTIQTRFLDTTLVDLTGQAENEVTDENGFVEIWAPPQGYTVFSLENYIPPETSTSESQSQVWTSSTLSTTENIIPTTTTSDRGTIEWMILSIFFYPLRRVVSKKKNRKIVSNW